MPGPIRWKNTGLHLELWLDHADLCHATTKEMKRNLWLFFSRRNFEQFSALFWKIEVGWIFFQHQIVTKSNNFYKGTVTNAECKYKLCGLINAPMIPIDNVSSLDPQSLHHGVKTPCNTSIWLGADTMYYGGNEKSNSYLSEKCTYTQTYGLPDSRMWMSWRRWERKIAAQVFSLRIGQEAKRWMCRWPWLSCRPIVGF